MSDEYFEEEEFEETWNFETLWRIAKLGLNHKLLLVGLFLGIAATSFSESYFGFLDKRMIDEGILANDLEQLMSIMWFYAGLWLLFAVFVFAFINAAGRMGHRVQYDLREAMFEKLQTLELAYYDKTPSGWLQARVTSDAVRVGDLVSWGFLDMVWAVANIVFSMGFMLYINWRLAIIVGTIIPIIVFVAVKFQRVILKEFRISRKANSKITGALSEMISGVRVVKGLGREVANLKSFTALTDEMYNASFRAGWLSALFLPIVQLISAFAVAAVIAAGGWQASIENSTGLTVGGLQAFVGYVTFMMWPIQQLARVYASMQQAIASGERIFSLLDTDATILDAQNAYAIESLEGDIVFDNVSFQYEAGKPVLEEFDLTIKQGETIAIVGPTGAGKTTVVNLVGRFYEPTQGEIRIGGRDYKEFTLHSIQSKLGIVLQTPHLFSGTIKDNLRYADLSAPDDVVIEAAKTAGAHGFISQLEDGYETQVGEGGVLLSVGQKQLISLGRAILADPDIFIMDEATSSVDTLTEALIQTGMDTLMQDRTSFVIAHRLSTIKNADRILVLEAGKIAEIGTHAELIRQRGHYYDLYTRQFRSEREQSISWGGGSPANGIAPA